MKINGVNFNENQYEMHEMAGDENINIIQLDFKVIGESSFNLYRELFKNSSYRVEFDDGTILDFVKINHQSSHQSPLNENTKVNFKVSLKEKTEDDAEEPGDFVTMMGNMMHMLASAFINQRALINLLVDRDIISREEYDRYTSETHESDNEEIRQMIFEGTSREKN